MPRLKTIEAPGSFVSTEATEEDDNDIRERLFTIIRLRMGEVLYILPDPDDCMR